jgi:hypothetical protein
MAYTKLFQTLLTSTVWQEDDQTRIVWITMLALADKHGEVQSTIPGLAHLSRVSLDGCEQAIKTFLAPDPYSRTPDDQGRRIEEIEGGWALLNHAKYREMASREESKEAERKRKARYREQQRRNEMSQDVRDMSQAVPETLHIAEADTDTDTKEGTPTAGRKRPPRSRTMKSPEFETIDPEAFTAPMTRWFHYRREIGKPFRSMGWEEALKSARKIPLDQLEAAVSHSIAGSYQQIYQPGKSAGIKHERTDSLNAPDRYK